VISREDFLFTIGYDGDTAIVDAKAKAQFGKLSTMELAQKSLFRAAFASALYSTNTTDFQSFAAYYNSRAGTDYHDPEAFMRLFGIKVETIRRVMSL
jgi:hypothetical protein